MSRLHLRGGRLIDPANRIDEVRDIFIAEGRIVGLKTPPDGFTADREIDVEGCLVIPGIIELGASLGGDRSAALAEESMAAVSAGVTSLCIAPQAHAPIDQPAVVELLHLHGTTHGHCRLFPIGGLTVGLKGERLTEMGALAEGGCVALSNGRHIVANSLILRRAMEYAAGLDLTVLLTPHDPWLRTPGAINEGETATRLGLNAAPAVAEAIGLYRDLALVELTGVRAHFCQITSARGIELIADAKARGLAVSADVAVHHLHLVDRDLDDFDTNYHLDPPLRDAADRDALRHAVADGRIDAVCSAHCPLGADAKRLPFPASEPGISGLETILALMLALADDGVISLSQAIAALSRGPARVMGLDLGQLGLGARADLCIVDPSRQWRLSAERMRSRGKNTPFLGRSFKGSVRATLVDGQIAYEAEPLEK